MNREQFMEIVYDELYSDGDNNRANRIIDAGDLYADEVKPHWIPVTEDTPTEDDDYWATFDAETGRFVDWASWYQGRWVTWIEGSPAPLSNVIAWQKSPEPYKG